MSPPATSPRHLDALLSSVADVVALLQVDGTFRYVSPACAQAWGCPPPKLLGTPLQARVAAEDRERLERALRRVRAAAGATEQLRLRLRHEQDAASGWRVCELTLRNQLAEPDLAGLVATFCDTTQRQVIEDELARLAFRDPLTGLANRTRFMQRLHEATTRAAADGSRLAVLFIDLDNFKLVNDSLGHAWGDEVLLATAARLRGCLRGTDTAARLGGDEFTVLIEQVPEPAAVVALADRIVDAIRAPVQLQGRPFFIGASVGIAISTPGAVSPDELLRNADVAMYRAKTSGKGRCAIFDRSQQAGLLPRLELESDLRLALERGELRVHYQPIVAVGSGELRALEALVRWEHPTRGLVPPNEFIPAAEETGLIVPIGQWVLETAVRQMRQWQLAFPRRRPLTICVNLSPRQFQHPDLLGDIARALRETGLDPRRLSVEITESLMLHDPQTALRKLQALRELGIQLAVDDFGTGYSSLRYLKDFPITTLKLDRCFVGDIDRDAYNAAIVRSVVALAATLGLRVTAEGIERPAELEQVRRLGCYGGQGYLFGRPAPAEAIQALVAAAPPALRQAA